MGVPDREGGSDCWSLDHLFLDQDRIPPFVECKRSSEPVITRLSPAQGRTWPPMAADESDEEECLKDFALYVVNSDCE